MISIEGKHEKLTTLSEYLMKEHGHQKIAIIDTIGVPELKSLCNIYITPTLTAAIDIWAYIKTNMGLLEAVDVVVLHINMKKNFELIFKALEKEVGKDFIITVQNELIETPIMNWL